MIWYCYILLCHPNILYTGITNNLEKRFEKHLSGKGAKFTKSHKPIKYVHIETLSSRPEALKRECAIKRLTRKQKEELIK